MSRVTIRDLQGLLSAIDCMNDSIEKGAEDKEFIADANHATQCYPWVLKEIRRRKNREAIRRAMKDTDQ